MRLGIENGDKMVHILSLNSGVPGSPPVLEMSAEVFNGFFISPKKFLDAILK
jgi:hypothetical protein